MEAPPLPATLPRLALALPTAFTLKAQTAGQGSVSIPTSGAPKAQPAFLRGLALLHRVEQRGAIDRDQDLLLQGELLGGFDVARPSLAATRSNVGRRGSRGSPSTSP